MRMLHNIGWTLICLIVALSYCLPVSYGQVESGKRHPLKGQVSKASKRSPAPAQNSASKHLPGHGNLNQARLHAGKNGKGLTREEGKIDSRSLNALTTESAPLGSRILKDKSRSEINLDENPLLKQELKVVASRDIYVVVDKSSSMHHHDCPGGLSRWHWCQYQAQYFSTQTASVLKNGITLAFFNHSYDIFPKLDARGVGAIFALEHLGMLTRPEYVLYDILSNYFRSGSQKPIAIAIVTDGKPNDPEALARVITEATWHMKRPDQIAITFLQVGYSDEGAEVLQMYDHLDRMGARYNIVDSQSFYELQRMGLLGAIANAVNKRIAASR